MFWGSGLNPELTCTTLPDYWPGKNNLGVILSCICDELFIADDNLYMSTEVLQEILQSIHCDPEKDPDLGIQFIRAKCKASSPLEGAGKSQRWNDK